MSTNRYGVDTTYFERWFDRALKDLSNYRPDELARELARMSRAADKEVVKENEFSGVSRNDILDEAIAIIRTCEPMPEATRRIHSDEAVGALYSLKTKKCASPRCNKEKPVGEMKTCMDSRPMARLVCDSKCMADFYN